MPQLTSAPELRPLACYEPSVPAHTDGADHLVEPEDTLAIPAQRRPEGQLSLRLWAPGHAGRFAAGLDRRKLAGALTAIVEAHGGKRPLRQIHAMLHPGVYRELLRSTGSTTVAYTLKSMHTHQPADGAVEVCGRVHRDRHALAMCARFEENESGWLCTEFKIMDPTNHR